MTTAPALATERFLTDQQREIARLQRMRGRACLEPAEADALATLHDSLLPDPGGADEATALLTRPVSRELEIPEYYRYTCLHVYGWFLDFFPDDPVAGALLALHTTLADLLEVERAAWVAGTGPECGDERIKRLDHATVTVRATVVNHLLQVRIGDLVDRAAADPELARRTALLAECTRFPRSDRHEENLFLRAVQCCETLFFLVRRLAVETAATKDEFPARAAARLELAGVCAGLLNDVFSILRTLTPEGFMTFRDFTGAASAVQSLNYHTMEISIYGYDPRKAEVFGNVDHLEVLNSEGVRSHHPLSAALADTADQRLEKGWAELDRALAKWRGGHYRFARTYLPSDTPASGGTDGAAYVKRFVKKDACVAGADPFGGLPLLSGFLYR
ncbi:tryptophan 2,3-dioxygenase [Streptomyces anulatus]|uniref:tryptophan 2,3-dioxygenase n=1 Tax=Streptomyces anulatus TaxID=1892 RepID=UPI001C25C5B0|nr:tryptophan 2,3-dioxygenase [Streptomyces anulatus]